MIPVLTIIGRPNVGKSTLFNYLTQSRDALVADMPGVTRDRQYGEGKIGDRPYIIVDTGGMAEPDDPAMAYHTDQQVEQAIQESDVLLFMVDGQEGLTAADQNIASVLRRRYADKVRILVNKADRTDAATICSDFHALGLGQPTAISSTQGRGISHAIEEILAQFPETQDVIEDQEAGIKIAVVGRPNVGKSTLINRLLGEERVIVFDRPGTTRDSIYIPFDHEGKRYTLIDTAGVRRKAKVHEVIEKFSIIKTMQAIEGAHVVVIVMDAHTGLNDQDLHLIGKVCEMGKALVLAVNKWDGMEEYDKEQFKQALDKRLTFVDFARRYFISAKHGSNVGKLYFAIQEAYESVVKPLSTSQLMEVLESALRTHQPPLVGGRRIKPRYIHVGGRNPLILIIHGKQLDVLPGSYRRYLANHFREALKLEGIPIIIRTKSDDNPYV